MEYVELGFRAALESPQSSGRLPAFLGATLRGAFGWHLKRTVCQVSHGRCAECLLCGVCPYPVLFEGLADPGRTILRKYPRVPQPFVLVVAPLGSRRPDGELSWGLRLFGRAARYWPYAVHVFDVAGQEGIGKARARFRLREVVDVSTGRAAWTSAGTSVVEPALQRVEARALQPPTKQALRWRFETPTKLQSDGAPLRESASGLEIVLAGRRRWRILQSFYGGATCAEGCSAYLSAESFVVRESSLRHWSFTRYSRRQERRMPLGGLVGEAVIEGPWHLAGDWLGAVKLIHLGKATSFGFGRVTWEEE